MRLILRIISYKGLPPIDAMSTEFSQQGGSIGRKHGNTLVLADDEHIVSGRHAEIVFVNNGFTIKDVSTNGTFLYSSGIELKNSSAPLADNDILRLGEYELGVQILADQVASHFNPFADGTVSSAAIVDPFASSFAPEPFAALATPTPDSLGIQPLFAGGDPFGQPESSLSQVPVFKEQPPSSPFQDSFVLPAISSVDTPEQDIAKFLKGLDTLGGVTPSQAVEPLPEAITVDPFAELAAIANPLPADNPPAAPTFALNDDLPLKTGIDVVPENLHTAPKIPSEPKPAIQDAELMRMFLAGAGITEQNLVDAQRSPEIMHSLGGLFRVLVEGLMDVLRARAEMKSEFRVSVTTLRSYDNNPLKFNPDVDSVLRLLIAPKNPAFTDADTAVKEAFKDVKLHQLAVTAGIQASLTEILARFNPEAIEKSLGEGLILQKKARCWEVYCERYPGLKNMAMDEFFGDQFAEAYEKQMLLLSKRQT